MKHTTYKLKQKLASLIASSPFGSRRPADPDLPRIFFCHVPKCAGSSIVSAIWKQVYSNTSACRFGIELAPSLRAAKVFDITMMQTRELILAYNLSIHENFFGSGHCYCRPNIVKAFTDDWNFVTILRNPVDRWISQYVFNTYKDHDWARNKLSLNEYLESPKGLASAHIFLHYFSNAPKNIPAQPYTYIYEALDNLSQFKVVGIVENLEQWKDRMNQCFNVSLDIGKSNVSPKDDVSGDIRSDARLMKRITELCQYDLEIYKRFVEQNSS
ncbi:MAG: sulfotransferase family 2 domain-containing protein [Acidobacteria bacterium]|nr:sulfotransferase family 2 domain-containing protein [Acidobacteriota bacterium]